MGMFDEVLDNVGEPFGGGKGFEYGTHTVVIGLAEAGQKKLKSGQDAEIINVDVWDKNDENKIAHCTLYFHTEGGAKMSVAKVLGILVHNAGEEKKDTVRELGKKLFGSFGNSDEDRIKSRDVAVKLLNEKMIGKEAYLVAEPTGSYKTTSYGDLWHYPAEPQGEPQNEAQQAAKDLGGSVVEDTELPDDLDL